MDKKIEKWVGYRFSSGGTTGEDYKRFERDMRIDLKRQAAKHGLVLHDFHKNHYEFSAVLKDANADRFAYVSISDVRFWQDEWVYKVLYRTMKHDKDWTGGGNHYCKWEDVGNSIAELLGIYEMAV